MAFNYAMSATGKAFHECDRAIKMLLGPYGSGKSCCCVVDILSYACAQAPAADGVRYSRVGVIRASYPELTSTTRKSLMEVFPSDCGNITGAMAPLRGVYIIPLPDGTTVNCELNLFAVSNADECSKLLSANWTFAWINEATGISKEVLTTVMTRVGRFPPQDLGGVSWGGILMDFNQPEQGSWLDNMVKNPDPGWGVFIQPPAAFQKEDANGVRFYEVNPDAENLRNLGSRFEGDPDLATLTPDEYDAYLLKKGMRYYENQIKMELTQGREDRVQNMYCMLDVPLVDGKPVYTNFSQNRHVSPVPLVPIQFVEIVIGMDQSGIHPACVIMQMQQGKWCIMDELYADGEGLENFLMGMLLPQLRGKYSTNPIIAAIDPSNQRDSWQGITPRVRLNDLGITAVTELSNSPKVRIQAVEHMLNLEAGGLLISPTCENLIRGFVHEYRYRRLRAGGSTGAAYTPAPEKNDSSHYHDALQYAAMLILQGSQTNYTELNELAQRMADKRQALRRVM